MSTHNICFFGELARIIPELPSNSPFNKSSDVCYIYWPSVCTIQVLLICAATKKKVPSDTCAQRRLKSASASTQSDQSSLSA